jgi:hypothetical protein
MYRLFILLILFLLAACGSPATPTVMPTATIGSTATATEAAPLATSTPSVAPQPAFIRLIHAAPQTESVNISLGDFLVASYLSFGVSTEKTQITAGDFTLRIMAGDATVDSASLYETELSIDPNASLILILTGTSDALTLTTYAESNEPLGENESRVTAIHAVPRGVDFTLRQGDTDLTPSVTFGQASSPVTLPSEETTITFQAGSTTLLSYPIQLRERSNYTLVLVGRSEDVTSLSVIAFDNVVPGRSSVRPIHAAFDVGSVDFYLDGERLAGGVDYSRAGDRVTTAAGTRLAAVYEAGADPQTVLPLFSQSLSLPENTTISLILLGSPTGMRFLPFVEDLSPTREGQTRLSFVNTVEVAPVVRVENMNGVLGDVYYGQQGEDVTFTAGVYTLFWNTIGISGSSENLEIGSELEFVAGRAYLYLFSGRDVSEPPLVFSEDVGVQGEMTDDTNGQIRFVNALGDQTAIDFYVDGSPVVTGLIYGQVSDLASVPISTRIVSVRVSGSLTDLTTIEYDISAGSYQTLFAYGDTTEVAQIRGLEDNFVRESDAASVRLVNLTPDLMVSFGLAYSIPTIGQAPTAIPTEEIVNENSTFRQSLPTDTQIALDGVRNQSVEEMVDTIAIPYGSRDIYVLDSATQLVGAYINAQIFEADTHYDVIAFQSSSSPLVRVFVVFYPIIDQ